MNQMEPRRDQLHSDGGNLALSIIAVYFFLLLLLALGTAAGPR